MSNDCLIPLQGETKERADEHFIISVCLNVKFKLQNTHVKRLVRDSSFSHSILNVPFILNDDRKSVFVIWFTNTSGAPWIRSGHVDLKSYDQQR